jgi:hypothetical protein
VWDVSSLWIVRPGDWHAVWVSWLASGDHLGWYVNLQMPYRRTAIGIEAMDLMLDVVVEPDLTWQWKDDDEFAEILQRGIFDQDTGARVRCEAEDVIRCIGDGDPRFAEPWPSWRPDPAWSLPVLPDGWDRPARRPPDAACRRSHPETGTNRSMGDQVWFLGSSQDVPRPQETTRCSNETDTPQACRAGST